MYPWTALLVALLAAVPLPSLAQESPAPPAAAPYAGRVGLGLNLGPTLGVSFSVPVQVSSSWRLEPEVGARNATIDTTVGRIQGHGVMAGLSLARTAPVGDQLRPYLGGRLQVATVSYSGSGLSAGSVRGAAVAGIEWFIVTRASLSIEAQAGYTHSDGDGDGLGLVPAAGFDAGGIVTLRLYAW